MTDTKVFMTVGLRVLGFFAAFALFAFHASPYSSKFYPLPGCLGMLILFLVFRSNA